MTPLEEAVDRILGRLPSNLEWQAEGVVAVPISELVALQKARADKPRLRRFGQDLTETGVRPAPFNVSREDAYVSG